MISCCLEERERVCCDHTAFARVRTLCIVSWIVLRRSTAPLDEARELLEVLEVIERVPN